MHPATRNSNSRHTALVSDPDKGILFFMLENPGEKS
jgi:hypothetical protein